MLASTFILTVGLRLGNNNFGKTKKQTDMNSTLRLLAIALLDDPNGVSEDAWMAFNTYASETAPGECDDIFDGVESSANRFYLPEDHGFTGVKPEPQPE